MLSIALVANIMHIIQCTVAPLGSCYVRNRISRHFQNGPLSNFVASKLCRFKTASLPKCVTSIIVAGSGDMRRSAPEDGCNNLI